MAILVNNASRILVQGITGRVASAHTRRMLAYGSNVVAGTSPFRAGEKQDGVPVYATVSEAAKTTGADVSVIFVPPNGSKDAIIEAADAGIELIVCVTEGTPVHEMLTVARRVGEKGVRLVGPCSPGLIVPGVVKVGFLPEVACRPGPVGLMSRSGTLSYEAAFQMTNQGIGQSTWIGVGGEMIKGTSFRDLLPMWEEDPETRVIVMMGEIGGADEEDAAAWYRSHGTKPLVAYIAGRTAPKGVVMGHAAAIVSEGGGSYQAKVEAIRAAGAHVAESLDDLAGMVGRLLDF